MRILHKYLLQGFLVMFGMSLLIFTFVMCLGAIVKAIDLLSRGVSALLIWQMFYLTVPHIMTFTIPMSALTSVLLLFSRLSSDGEVNAMKACGLSIWQVVNPLLAASLLLSGLCVYLNSIAAPNSHYAQRQLLREVGVEDPLSFLDAGRFVREFPGLMIYVGDKKGQQLKNVVVYEMGDGQVKRSIRANSGVVSSDEETRRLLVDLYDVRIDQPDPQFPADLTRTRYINAKRYPLRIDFDELLSDKKPEKRRSDMTVFDLIRGIRDIRSLYPDLPQEETARERTRLMVEASERLSISFACFAFVVLGIPLGVRSPRKESSAGIAISLMVVFVFYLFIIIAKATVKHPHLHPEFIVWTPVVLSVLAGLYMLRRSN